MVVREVQSSTGVRVFNVSERKNSDATAYVVGAPEAVQNAASWLEDKITESAPVRKRGGWSIPVAGPGEVTKELSLAQSAAGWVIGPKGSRLAQVVTPPATKAQKHSLHSCFVTGGISS